MCVRQTDRDIEIGRQRQCVYVLGVLCVGCVSTGYVCMCGVYVHMFVCI